MEREDLEMLFRALAAEGVEYALVGGMAMNLHGLARFTEDVDIFVRLDQDNVARLKRALEELYNDPDVDEITFEDLSGPYPVIRYVPPRGTPTLDIIGRLGERVAYDDVVTVGSRLGASPVSLASAASLHAMKADTVRPVDQQDAERLRKAFDLEEEEL